jgi:hypothetical protein
MYRRLVLLFVLAVVLVSCPPTPPPPGMWDSSQWDIDNWGV